MERLTVGEGLALLPEIEHEENEFLFIGLIVGPLGRVVSGRKAIAVDDNSQNLGIWFGLRI